MSGVGWPGCRFDNGWAGVCGGRFVNDDGLCSEHAAKECKVCGEQALMMCNHTGQFVCGYPLCPDHKNGCCKDHGGIDPPKRCEACGQIVPEEESG